MLDTFKITERKTTVLNLKKEKGIDGQLAQVVLCLDFSGSMDWLYRNGTVQDTVERILPLGLAFDDNGQVDAYIFESGFRKMKENITLKNLDGYVNNKIWGKYSMGGTNYAPVINDIISEFGNPTTGGFLSKKTISPAKQPTYVIFITDGDNSDKREAEQAVIEASSHGIFFQFVGIGMTNFPFLEKLDNMSGRKVDNANFFKISDISRVKDNELYSKLMNEFPSWLSDARNAQIIL